MEQELSWAYGVLPDGREVGYSVLTLCDEPGCEEAIDRGLSYVCGGMHEGGDDGCGGYFCPAHLLLGSRQRMDAAGRWLDDYEGSEQLCARCLDKWETENE